MIHGGGVDAPRLAKSADHLDEQQLITSIEPHLPDWLTRILLGSAQPPTYLGDRQPPQY